MYWKNMSVIIHKEDSEKAVQKAVQKAIDQKKKNHIELDRYFGKVSYDIDGLQYQKKIRNEWK
jgi:ribosomal protein S5